MTDANIVKAHCNQCLRETRHFVVAVEKQEYNEENPDGSLGYWEHTYYEMLKCCGCENITLRSTLHVAGDPERRATYFPPAVTRPKPRWMSGLVGLSAPAINRALVSLFHEVYAALHAGSNRLAMMGARAIIDMVLLDKVGDQGTFAEKLSEMQKADYISRASREFLAAAIEAGHAATHRGHASNDADVNRVMDIVENLVQTVYVLETAARTLHKNTPRRSTKPPAP
ncbi:hypothetical protein RAS1_15480 [Phycisphaerae bacterium RAS1]|nr:hypothetical protein RAS1_15480 [Phycisphaerae bacterium RAS1]